MGTTDSGRHIPVRIDEKTLDEKDRRPYAGTFDRLVDVNLRLTDQVRNLVWSIWAFMLAMVLVRLVEFHLTGH